MSLSSITFSPEIVQREKVFKESQKLRLVWEWNGKENEQRVNERR